MPDAVIIIPARLGSTRFPGKVLQADTGKPMIAHVIEQAKQASCAQRVVVATDDADIAAVARDADAEAVMTRPDHPNGTSRLAEAAQLLRLEPNTLVVNVQGDEPEIEPALIDAVATATPVDGIGTIAAPSGPGDDPDDPNMVKVVTGLVDESQNGAQALYFSRSRIPSRTGPVLKHLGLYAYTVKTLATYAALPATPLEQAERLEQLRALEHGMPIRVAIREAAHRGVDTPEDYAAFVARWRKTASA